MNRVSLTLCCVLLVLLAAFGGKSSAKRAGPVSVHINVVKTVTYDQIDWPLCKKGQVATAARPCGNAPPLTQEQRTTRAVHSFSLTCNPTGGTLPLANIVCEDIRRYPAAMLHPQAPEPYPGYHMCSGSIISSTTMSVSVTASGTSSSVSGQLSGCFSKSPPYDALLIYYTAISRNQSALLALGPGLRCAHHPGFLCVFNIAGGIEETVWSAERARALNPLRPLSFPEGLGTQNCPIRVGPFASTKYLSGQCSVDLEGLEEPSSKPVVVFTETWPLRSGETDSHTWRVRVSGYTRDSKVISVTESGTAPPNRWR